MAVWTLKMNIIDKPDAFAFCKMEQLIGFGWGIPDGQVPDLGIQTLCDYEEARKNYEPYKGSSVLTACINAFKSMSDGDLIWTLDDSNNTYYLCKITGEYKHLSEKYSEKYGIANCMKVYSYNPISENLVPPDVKRRLHSRGIIYRLNDENRESIAISLSLYDIIEKLNP